MQRVIKKSSVDFDIKYYSTFINIITLFCSFITPSNNFAALVAVYHLFTIYFTVHLNDSMYSESKEN